MTLNVKMAVWTVCWSRTKDSGEILTDWLRVEGFVGMHQLVNRLVTTGVKRKDITVFPPDSEYDF